MTRRDPNVYVFPSKLPDFLRLGWLAGALLAAGPLAGQTGTATSMISTNATGAATPHTRRQQKAMSDEYRSRAFRLMLDQANDIARNLALPEKLPFTEQSAGAFVSQPEMARELEIIGTIETPNYSYSFANRKKFCFLTLQHLDEKVRQWLDNYVWPVRLADTNGAYCLATQWLAAASMDVVALNRDCRVRVDVGGLKGHGRRQTFTPVYWVLWQKDPKSRRPTACVQLFAPTKTLIQLRVKDPRYILRKPIDIN